MLKQVKEVDNIYLIRKDEPKEVKDTNKENQKVETIESATPVDVEIEEEEISKEEVEDSKIESEEETSEDEK